MFRVRRITLLMYELLEPDLFLPARRVWVCFPRRCPVLHCQGVSVSNWKKVVHLVHHYLTRTLSENADLLAQRDRLAADLLRTELELEETAALVSSLLAGQGPVVYSNETINGSSTAATNLTVRQPHHASWDLQDSLDDDSNAGSSTIHQRSLDGNTGSSADSSTNHQGPKPAAGVPDDGGDLDPVLGSLDGLPAEETGSNGSSDRIGDTLTDSPVVLSRVVHQWQHR